MSLFDNSEFDIEDLDAIDYLDSIDFIPSSQKKASQQPQPQQQQQQSKTNGNKKKPPNKKEMNSDQSTRANLKRIQDKTLQLEKDRRGTHFRK